MPSIDRDAFAVGVGRRFRAMRAMRGLTQFELAHRAGYHKNTIGNIEIGACLPSLTTVLVIAEALEVSPKDLLFGPEE
jgi:DNA-binding XRE family transcriptional regulator